MAEVETLTLVPPLTDEERKEKERNHHAARSRAFYAANKKQCRAAHKTWYERNKEKHRAYGKAYNEAHKAERKARSDAWYAAHRSEALAARQVRRLRTAYGLTQAAFDALLQVQDGRCAICRNEFTRAKRSIHVDHDHVTGRVRGLLCHGCNMGLGGFRDSPSSLVAAVAYLRPKETS